MNLRENTTYMATTNRIYYKKKIIHDHQLIKGSKVIALDKLTSTEICSVLISKVLNKPSSNIYFGNLFNDYNIDWAANCMLPRLITYNTYM